jgi:hypothetical protein
MMSQVSVLKAIVSPTIIVPLYYRMLSHGPIFKTLKYRKEYDEITKRHNERHNNIYDKQEIKPKQEAKSLGKPQTLEYLIIEKDAFYAMNNRED